MNDLIKVSFLLRQKTHGAFLLLSSKGRSIGAAILRNLMSCSSLRTFFWPNSYRTASQRSTMMRHDNIKYRSHPFRVAPSCDLQKRSRHNSFPFVDCIHYKLRISYVQKSETYSIFVVVKIMACMLLTKPRGQRKDADSKPWQWVQFDQQSRRNSHLCVPRPRPHRIAAIFD